MSAFNNDNNTTEDVVFLKNQLAVARNEISNLRQQLRSLKSTYRKDCDEIRQQLENWRCIDCRNRQLEQANSSSSTETQNCTNLPLQYIGIIYTHFPEKRGTPRQPGVCPDITAKLILNKTVFTNPEHALEGLQEYSHMWILFHFHKNDSTHGSAKVAPPRLNGLRTGVFATRSPHRPNPIGLSLVKIDRIMDSTIYFNGVDMVNETPVLDIKPYIPQYDNPSLSLPFDSNAVDISHMSDIGRDSTDSLVNDSSLNSLSFNDLNLHDNVNVRVMDGEENVERDQALVGASSLPINNINLEDNYHESRLVSRIGEREAPDGEEEETPRQAVINNPQSTTPQRQIRVPTWIDQPPISTLTVHFKQRALIQLQQLGSEGEQKKSIIKNVLQEDPRSVYLRERVENTNYIFRIADLYVSCKFDDAAHIVTVFQVFQDSVPQTDD